MDRGPDHCDHGRVSPLSETRTAVDRPPVGVLLSQWRSRRGRSQMQVAHAAGISPRHLSFVETGRAQASVATIERLAESLELPLRERNALLIAAGHAPRYGQSPLSSDQLAGLHRSLDTLVHAHLPFPAVVIDRYGDVLLTNAAMDLLFSPLPSALRDPINVFRAVLHPDGLGDVIENRSQWAIALQRRLREAVATTADPLLADLLTEIADYPICRATRAAAEPRTPQPVLPLTVRLGDQRLTFAGLIAVLDEPRDVTAAELMLETFVPLDEATRLVLEALAAGAADRSGPSAQQVRTADQHVELRLPVEPERGE